MDKSVKPSTRIYELRDKELLSKDFNYSMIVGILNYLDELHFAREKESDLTWGQNIAKSMQKNPPQQAEPTYTYEGKGPGDVSKQAVCYHDDGSFCKVCGPTTCTCKPSDNTKDNIAKELADALEQCKCQLSACREYISLYKNIGVKEYSAETQAKKTLSKYKESVK